MLGSVCLRGDAALCILLYNFCAFALRMPLGLLADRLSVNIELPSAQSLALLAPDKKKQAILAPMGQIRVRGQQSRGVRWRR